MEILSERDVFYFCETKQFMLIFLKKKKTLIKFFNYKEMDS